MATAQMTSPFALLGRLMWFIAGPLILAALAFFILDSGGGWLTPVDVAFFVVLGAMLLGRVMEFRYGAPTTASGTPATRQHLWRYLVVAPLVALGTWVLANLLGNHLLPAWTGS